MEYKALTDYEVQMKKLAESITLQAKENQLNGNIIIGKKYIKIDGDLPIINNLLYRMLEEREEINSVEPYGNDLYVSLAEPYINTNANTNLNELNYEQIEIMGAKHVLWHYGVGGERADFSNSVIRDKDLSFMFLENAVFDNAELIRADLPRDSIDYSTFRNAALYYNENDFAVSQANFKGAKFYGWNCDTIIFESCNLTNARFLNCNFERMSLRNCCIEGIDFGNLDPEKFGILALLRCRGLLIIPSMQAERSLRRKERIIFMR